MVERVCPRCQHGNPLDDQFCGRCGSSLIRLLPVPQGQQTLTVAGKQLPLTVAQLGKGLALGLAALAAEAGMAWLRSRVERTAGAAPTTTALTRSIGPQPPATGDITMIVSQRVLEVWEHGELTRKVVERSAWRKSNQK